MTEIPNVGEGTYVDLLSSVLESVRLSGSLQFCFMPSGDWQTDAKPSLANLSPSNTGVMPFHIMAEGTCWLRIEGDEVVLHAGDIVVFPFGTGHQLGAGKDGRLIIPTGDLPQKPWARTPVLHYGEGPDLVRLLCGYLHCEVLDFAPLQRVLPKLVHIRTTGQAELAWLSSMVRQIVREVDEPRHGSQSMIERMTELTLIEVLRHQMSDAEKNVVQTLPVMSDAVLSRCLNAIHRNPEREWTLRELASISAVSRSGLIERFQTALDTSPMRYLRDWRLYLASVRLRNTSDSITRVAIESNYGSEAAFSRAFTRAYGLSPGAWRQQGNG
ncbi:AraC family transcriptional regulator [Rhizobium sp. TH2]|uniref:AraC family transcriptional regulator n=1 Tax=Rhizobium sp. TH2 TaxID=2775403 RepID=UPI002157CC80|nr:AraC family transcriptional regulator [Rhizobium sp. TH2]